MNVVQISTPLSKDVVASLHCGDAIEITGTLYTARDAAHARLVECLEKGKPLPFNLQDYIIYYAGPAPAKPGQVIGSCGPTTAGRMDSFTPTLLQAGLRAMIGKGPRSKAVVDTIKETGAIYFAAVGGAAALTAQSITAAEVIAYEDLGPEAIRKLEVVRYPCIVAIDSYGQDIYEIGPTHYARESARKGC